MGRSLQILGLIGTVLTLFGTVAYLATEDPWDPYVLSHLGLGILCLLIFFTTQLHVFFGSFRRRSTRHGIHSVVYSIFFLGILVMLNFLNTRYHYRWDLTENKVFSLAPQSKQILQQLRNPLEIYGFFEKGQAQQLADLVKVYAYESPKVQFYTIDIVRRPEMVRQYKIQQPNTLHLRYGNDSMNITEISEDAITNGILRLTRTGRKNICYLTGHGEPGIQDRQDPRGFGSAKEALENENYNVQELFLGSENGVPGECVLLMIAGPKNPLWDNETKAITGYAGSGGNLLILLPSQGGDGLKKLLKNWGVEVGDDIIVDQMIRLFAGPALGVEPIAENYSATHPITRNFTERTVFPMARSVAPQIAPRDGFELASIVKSSPTSWAEKDVKGIFQESRATPDPEDIKGPVSIGVAGTARLDKDKTRKDGASKFVVLGTAEIASNRYLNRFFNRDFLLNAVNWLAGEESLISVRPRTIRASRIQLTQRESRAAFYLSFLIVPEILLMLGLAVWWRRR